MKLDGFKNVIKLKSEFTAETISTIRISVLTMIIGCAIGLLLGIILVLTRNDGLKKNKVIYFILDKTVNIFRSLPFVILIALVSPLTRSLVGTTIGEKGALVPMVIGTFPFFARQVENVLSQVDKGILEAAQSMGLSTSETVRKVYLPESFTDLIKITTLTFISVIGLSAMAGAVGAGGLGKLAINSGYYRYKDDVVLTATVIILLIVFIIQWTGSYLEKKSVH